MVEIKIRYKTDTFRKTTPLILKVQKGFGLKKIGDLFDFRKIYEDYAKEARDESKSEIPNSIFFLLPGACV